MMPLLSDLLRELRREETLGKIDHRALGGPPEWDATKEDGFREWHIKVQAWLVNQASKAINWLKRASMATESLTTATLDVEVFDTEQDREQCKKFNSLLYNILITKLKGEAFSLVTSVSDGCGFEAWRLLMKRYEPRTPATKRALLKTIFNMKAAKKVDEIEKNILKLEETYKRYEAMSDAKLPEDIKTVIMIELCTPKLKDHLEFTSKDLSYKETREAVIAYVERKRKDPYTPMEVGNQENHLHEHHEDNWDWEQNVNEDTPEVNYYGKANYKGKGPSPGQKGKGKGPWKGGGKKGAGKSNATNTKGNDGKGAGFQGFCNWCGKWGHPATRCRDKDSFMEWVRSGKQDPTPSEAYGVQSNGDGNTSEYGSSKSSISPSCTTLSSIESPVRTAFLGSVDKTTLKLQNRYAVLSIEEEDTLSQETPYGGPVGSSRGRWRREPKLLEMSSCEVYEVNSVNKSDYMEITIDSGASENVMPPHMAPGTILEH